MPLCSEPEQGKAGCRVMALLLKLQQVREEDPYYGFSPFQFVAGVRKRI